MINYLTTGNFTKTKAETIKAFIAAELERLCDKWHIQYSALKLDFYQGKNRTTTGSVSCSVVRDPDTGAFIGKSYDKPVVFFKLRDFHNSSKNQALYIVRHEFAHVLQYTYIPPSDLKSCYRKPMTDLSLCVSNYARTNQLEAWAEAFAMYENGRPSYRSLTMDDVNRALESFWERMPF